MLKKNDEIKIDDGKCLEWKMDVFGCEFVYSRNSYIKYNVEVEVKQWQHEWLQ